jgi:hypothetical protein
MLVRKGDHGSGVREIQGNLRLAGLPLKVDGRFGPETDAAVRTFQKSHHLPVDGVVGPRTLATLHNRSKKSAVPAADRFDPAEFGRWLSQLPGTIYDALTPDAAQATPAAPRPRAAARAPAAAAAPKAAAAVPRGKPIVSPRQNRQHRRLTIPGHAESGYVLQDYEKYKGYAIELSPGRSIAPWNAAALRNNQCAHFVQFFGVALTKAWRRGPQVCFLEQGEIPVGTVVATLRDGFYHNDISGRSHVGIYLGHDPVGTKGGGVWLLDQWKGVAIDRRKKRYDGDTGRAAPIRATGRRFNWSNDGEEYFVLLA